MAPSAVYRHKIITTTYYNRPNISSFINENGYYTLHSILNATVVFTSPFVNSSSEEMSQLALRCALSLSTLVKVIKAINDSEVGINVNNNNKGGFLWGKHAKDEDNQTEGNYQYPPVSYL